MRVGSCSTNKVARVVLKGASDGKLHYLTMFEKVLQPLLELSTAEETREKLLTLPMLIIAFNTRDIVSSARPVKS